MKRWRVIAFALLVCTVALSGVTNAQEVVRESPSSKSSILQYGPFTLSGKAYTVQVTQLEAVNPVAKNRVLMWERTVSEIRILDIDGSLHFEETYNVPLHDNGFEYSIRIGTDKIIGEKGQGIILTREAVPSAPGGGRSFLVLVPKNGQMMPISRWLTVYGSLGLPVAEDGALSLPPGDEITFSVWTGWFGVLVPVLVDMEEGRISVPEVVRSYKVEAEGPLFREEPVPLTLYLEPSDSASTVTVPVRKDSRVQYLEAFTAARLYGKATLELQVDSTPWLKVRVDGQEGWVRGNAGYIGVGLMPAG